MKKTSSFIFAFLLAIFAMVSGVQAQTLIWGGVTGGDWQTESWGLVGQWPGRDATGYGARFTLTGAMTVNNATPANAIGKLTVEGTAALTLNGLGTLTCNDLEINNTGGVTVGTGLSLVVNGLVDVAVLNGITVLTGGSIRFNRTGANTFVQPIAHFAAGNAGGTIIFGAGANNGVFPANIFTAANLYAIKTLGNMRMAANFSFAAGGSELDLGGTFTVPAGISLTLAQTLPGSLVGTGSVQGEDGGVVSMPVTAATPFNGGLIPGSRFGVAGTGFVGRMALTGAGTGILESSLTFGQNGSLDLSAGATTILRVNAGVALRFNGTQAGALLPTAGNAGTIQTVPGSLVEFGAGANNGVLVFGNFQTVQGTIKTNSAMGVALTASANPFAPAGVLNLGGDLSVAGAFTLTLSQTGVNSLTGTGRITPASALTMVALNCNFNAGVINGANFANPFEGGLMLNGTVGVHGGPATADCVFNLNGTLVMGSGSANGGFLGLSGGSGTTTTAYPNNGNDGPTILNIGNNSTLRLNRTATNSVLGRSTFPFGTASPYESRYSYIQGVNNTSVLEIGTGFNGGTFPGATGAFTPTTGTLTLNPPSFNGKVKVISSSQLPGGTAAAPMGYRDLMIGTGGGFEVDGVFIINAGGSPVAIANAGVTVPIATLILNNQGASSLAGAGTIQAAAGGALANPGKVVIGPGMNNGILPGARFASPFTGWMSFTNANTTTIQGDMTIGLLNNAASFSCFDVSSATINLGANTTLTLNSSTTGSLASGENYAAATTNLNPINTYWRDNDGLGRFTGSIQGANATSKIIFNNGFNGGYFPTTATIPGRTILATPFNGTVQIEGNYLLGAGFTLGLSGQLVLNGSIQVTTNNVTIELNNTAANSITGTGFINGATNATVSGQDISGTRGGGVNITTVAAGNESTIFKIGPGFNGGVFPGNRFNQINGIRVPGYYVTANATGDNRFADGTTELRFSGVLQFPNTAMQFTGFLNNTSATQNPNNTLTTAIQLNNTLTLQANSRLTLNTTGATTAGLGGTGTIQGTDCTSELVIGGHFPRVVAAVGTTPAPIGFQGTNSSNTAGGRGQINPVNLASPFNGRLTVSTSQATLDLVTNALTIGATGCLTVNSVFSVQNPASATLNNTGAASFSGTAQGRLTATAATVTLGANFNAGIIPGNLLGTPGAYFATQSTSNVFTGTLVDPSTASTFTGALSFDDLTNANNGVLNLGAGGNLTVQNGAELRLSDIAAGTLSTGGKICGEGNNSNVVIPAGAGVGTGMGADQIDGNVFCNPYNGRITMAGAAARTLQQGSLVIGTANLTPGLGVLDLSSASALTVNANTPVGSAVSLVLNNTSPVANSLPGTSLINGNTNTGVKATSSQMILGPGANGGIVPGDKFVSPYRGWLITSGPMTLNANLTEEPGPANNGGTLDLGGDLTMPSSVPSIQLTLSTANPSLTGTGRIVATDESDYVVFNGAGGVSANGGNIPGARFSTPWLGQIHLTNNTPGMSLQGRLTVGAESGSRGALVIGADNLTVPAGAAGAFGHLVLNNTTTGVLTFGAGRVTVAGLANNDDNGRVTYGPGANTGIINGGAYNANTISGTLISSTASYTAQGNITFAATSGRIILGGSSTSHTVTLPAATTWTMNNTTQRAMIGGSTATTQAQNSGMPALGNIQGTDNTSIFAMAALANGGGASPLVPGAIVPAEFFQDRFVGQLQLAGTSYLASILHPTLPSLGQLRIGNNGGTGQLNITAGTEFRIGTNSTLTLQNRVAGGALPGTGTIAAMETGTSPATVNNSGTSKLILGNGFSGGATNTAVLSTAASIFPLNVFGGALVTSTGTFTLPNAGTDLTIGSNGSLEKGGFIIVATARTLTLRQTAANTLSYTSTGAGGVAASEVGIDARGTGAVVLGNGIGTSFNGGVFPTNCFGIVYSTSGTRLFGVDNGAGTGTLTLNGPSVTMSPEAVNLGLMSTTLGGAPAAYNGNNGSLLTIPKKTSLAIRGQFLAAAPNGGIQGTDTTSILVLDGSWNGGAPAGITINATSTRLGSGTPNPAFNGTVRNLMPVTHTAVPVTIGTVGALDLRSTWTVDLNTNLNLNQTGANTLTGTGVLNGNNTASAIIALGSGFNAGLVPGNRFNNPLNATLRIGGTLTLSAAALTIGPNGVFDFTAGATNRKFYLGNFDLTSQAADPLNYGTTNYFVTNGTGLLCLGATGSKTFPLGTATTYLPLLVANSGTAQTYCASVNTTISPAAPQAAYVNGSWSLKLATGSVVPGSQTQVSPQWPTSAQVNNFQTASNVIQRLAPGATAYTTAGAAGPAVNVAGLTNYFQQSTIYTPADVNTWKFIVTSVPSITGAAGGTSLPSLTPTSGPAGTVVTLTGAGFVSGAGVTVGGVAATGVTASADGKTLTFTVGTGTPTGAQNIVVTQSGAPAVTIGGFTVTSTLVVATITSVTPATLNKGLGVQLLTIKGTNFGTPSAVSFVGSSLTANGKVISQTGSTDIVVEVPAQISNNLGTVTLTVTATGRTSPSTTVSVIDAPLPAIVSATPSSTTANLTAYTMKVTGSNFSKDSRIKLNGVELAQIVQSNGLSFAQNGSNYDVWVEVPGSLNIRGGSYPLIIENTDSRTSAPFTYNVTSYARPYITVLEPTSSLPGAAQFTMTIRGLNFATPVGSLAGAKVEISDVPVTITSQTNTEIKVVVPASLVVNPGLLVVEVINPDDQTGGARFPVAASTAPAPFITTLDPVGTTASAKAFTIKIKGSNFVSGAKVFLGASELSGVVFKSSTDLEAVISAAQNVAGTYMLTVTNPDFLSGSKTFEIGTGGAGTAPAITAVTPASNTQKQLTSFEMTIDGDNFKTGAIVKLDNVTLTVKSVSANKIVVTIPNNAVSGQYVLVVTNPDGQTASQQYGLLKTDGTVDPNKPTGIRVNNAIPVSVYPNPASDLVTIEARFAKQADVVITITNMLGQTIQTMNVKANAGQFTKPVNVSNLANGTYLVDVNDGTNRTIQTIIIKK